MKNFTALALILSLSATSPLLASDLRNTNVDEESSATGYGNFAGPSVDPAEEKRKMLEGMAQNKLAAAEAFIKDTGLDELRNFSILSDIVPAANMFFTKKDATAITQLLESIKRDPNFLALPADNEMQRVVYLFENKTFNPAGTK